MKCHILIAHPDPEHREDLIRSLGEANAQWQTSAVGSLDAAKSALSSPAADKGPVDLVLASTRVGQRAAGAVELLEYAKRLDPLITVILLAPAGEPIDRLETYRNGAFDCLMAGKQRGAEAWREVAVKAGLALDFRRLSLDQIADRERISTLSRAFDPRLLQLLDEDPPALGVRMRRATIVFADIRGYSKLCDRLTAQPDVLQGFLFDYYSTASDAVFKHGGILDKFLGDVVMAIFCDDLIGDDRTGAGPAAAAALRMEDHFERVLRKWRVQWGGAGALKLGLACAIHSGECLVGNLGTTDREQFTAIGPHVNFAAQLRGLAKGGQIVVSEDAGRTLPPSYRLETLGTLEKIKSLPGRSIPVYRLRGRG